MAAEDARFCIHHGIDFGELRAAIEDADDISEMRGGSTIAQQTAKNLFLWQGRSVIRKALEFPLALWLDLVLGKRRLMEIYLNIAEWGPNGEFGAEAAARHAFDRSARELGAREAALLAAILPNPVSRSAARPGAGVRRLAGIYQGGPPGWRAECLRRPGKRDPEKHVLDPDRGWVPVRKRSCSNKKLEPNSGSGSSLGRTDPL